MAGGVDQQLPQTRGRLLPHLLPPPPLGGGLPLVPGKSRNIKWEGDNPNMPVVLSCNVLDNKIAEYDIR